MIDNRNRNDRSECNFDEIQNFITDLEKDIAATSTETVKARLVKNYPGKLNSKRDKIADFCKRKFVDFPKDKLLRSISRLAWEKSSNQLQKSQAEPRCADEHENSNISETAKNQVSINKRLSNPENTGDSCHTLFTINEQSPNSWAKKGNKESQPSVSNAKPDANTD
ncbi:Hypothetical predicted protein [Paramuricea clavata]|uniref:Uncharacterized protein n=1 Tax=Paramuricea clavata TaxID=317549 RepID=A0A7D9EWR3_PARCT|nr:Hypothetical predicted protein [Paramuricea clavata]